MKLVELFTDPYKIEWAEHNENEIDAVFVTDYDTSVTVSFDRMGMNLWSISFDASYWDSKNNVRVKTFLKTGQGDAPRIFATVIAAIQDFVNKYKPKYIWFTASYNEPSRVKLYTTMAKKFAQNQFELIEHPDQDPELPGYVSRRLGATQEMSKHFVLRNKNFGPIKDVAINTSNTQLNELFDKPYPIEWGENANAAKFVTDLGTSIIITFREYDNLTTIVFAAYYKDAIGNDIVTMYKTGFGDASRIFATVISAIKEYLKKHNPDYLFFTADEPSRQKLYVSMVKALGRDYTRINLADYQSISASDRVKEYLNGYASEVSEDEAFLLEKNSIKKRTQLNELFAQPYEFEVQGNVYTFETASGNMYKVLFEEESVYDKETKRWLDGPGVVFGLMNQDRDFKMSVERTGDAPNVFATVFAITKQYLSQNPKHQYLIFASSKSEPSRMKLYNTFMKMAQQYIPGFVAYKIIDDFDNQYRFYVLEKKGREN